jgi:hypothetical protein
MTSSQQTQWEVWNFTFSDLGSSFMQPADLNPALKDFKYRESRKTDVKPFFLKALLDLTKHIL